MKYFYALPLAFILLTACKSDKKEEKETPIDPKKTDIYALKLNGKVKDISSKSYSYENAVKGNMAFEDYTKGDADLIFDAKGMLGTERKYNANGISEENTYQGKSKLLKNIQFVNGQPGIITENSYNKNGNLTSITRRDKSNVQIDRIEMVYEGKNMIEKNTYNNQNTPIDKITYDYDAKGNMIGENIFMGTQSVKVRAKYDYDSKGNRTAETRFSDNKAIYTTVYSYEGDKLTWKETTNPEGKPEHNERKIYDDKGNLIKTFEFNKLNNSQSEENRTYDNKNNVLTITVSEKKKVMYKESYTYDDHNNILTITSADGDGKVLKKRSYTYEYDGNNNWIKKTVTVDDKPAFLVERKINYF